MAFIWQYHNLIPWYSHQSVQQPKQCDSCPPMLFVTELKVKVWQGETFSWQCENCISSLGNFDKTPDSNPCGTPGGCLASHLHHQAEGKQMWVGAMSHHRVFKNLAEITPCLWCETDKEFLKFCCKLWESTCRVCLFFHCIKQESLLASCLRYVPWFFFLRLGATSQWLPLCLSLSEEATSEQEVKWILKNVSAETKFSSGCD